jgi:hypothetical protein
MRYVAAVNGKNGDIKRAKELLERGGATIRDYDKRSPVIGFTLDATRIDILRSEAAERGIAITEVRTSEAAIPVTF